MDSPCSIPSFTTRSTRSRKSKERADRFTETPRERGHSCPLYSSSQFHAEARSARRPSEFQTSQGSSKLDRAIWSEFHENLNEGAPESEEALRKLFGADEHNDLEVSPKDGIKVIKLPPTGPTDTLATVKLRRGQQYFREAVINNSGGCCVVSRLSIRELLVASHILPWGKHPKYRLDVRNGLCLSRLHDAAFDRGLITFDDQLRMLLSPQLKSEISQRSVAENFGMYSGEPLHFPDDAALPDTEFIKLHRSTIFRK